jgi:hypothetical protein
MASLLLVRAIVGLSHVVEHADVAYSQSKLRTREAAQPLDPALAPLRRFMPQMSLNCVFDLRSGICAESLEVLDCLRGEEDLVPHSG